MAPLANILHNRFGLCGNHRRRRRNFNLRRRRRSLNLRRHWARLCHQLFLHLVWRGIGPGRQRNKPARSRRKGGREVAGQVWVDEGCVGRNVGLLQGLAEDVRVGWLVSFLQRERRRRLDWKPNRVGASLVRPGVLDLHAFLHLDPEVGVLGGLAGLHYQLL